MIGNAAGQIAMPEPNASEYFASETLRDGSTVEIRALRPQDRSEMLAAVQRTSSESLFRRFFGPKRNFSEKEVAYFMEVDFDSHVALVARIVGAEGTEIVAGGRYIRTAPHRAELAFVVIDEHQGKGIGTALLRQLIALAREAGLNELTAEVLPENRSMLAVFRKAGFEPGPRHDPRVAHLSLQLAQAGDPAKAARSH